jgi:soluble lytic murein transglycosylase
MNKWSRSLFSFSLLIFLTLPVLSSDVRFETEVIQEMHADQVMIRKKILSILKKYLPKAYDRDSYAISRAIIAQARKYQLDPLVVTAVIAGESSFNPRAIGSVGEIGLMQVRPETGQWIARMLHWRWQGRSSLLDPITNIRYGTAYLSYLRQFFRDKGYMSEHLYLAAYNMGAGTVLKNLARHVEPQIYKRHVMKRYLSLNE